MSKTPVSVVEFVSAGLEGRELPGLSLFNDSKGAKDLLSVSHSQLIGEILLFRHLIFGGVTLW